MLNFSIMCLDREHISEVCSDIEYQVKNGISTMPLFCMTLTPEGVPTIDKAALCCEVYEKYKTELDKLGLPSGALIQASIGHGWQLNAPSAFQKYVGLADGAVPEICCPCDPDFKAYIRRSAKKIASTHPDHIMLDDDFRLMFRSSKGCACPLHMQRFNDLAKTSFTREELYEALCRGDDNSARYKEIFVKVEIESLIECAREIRAGIDEIDPTIPGSYCSCGTAAEGAYEIAKIMAGSGNPIVMRLNNANYCPTDYRKFSHIMYRAATQISALSGKPDIILAETDTCPQTRYSTSAAMLHSHFTFSILEGAKGAKHWITRLSCYEPKSGKVYREKLKKYCGFYHELASLNDKLTWLGCKIPMPSAPFYAITPADDLCEATGWHNTTLDKLGVPMHFSVTGSGACFFSSGYDGKFTDSELLSYLSGKVVLDGEAAESLIRRGYGKYLGVNVERIEPNYPTVSGEILNTGGTCRAQFDIRKITVTSENVKIYSHAYHLTDGVRKDLLFPSVTSYQNELGGTVVVFAGNSSFPTTLTKAFGWLNESRKCQIVQILSDLGELPVYCPSDGELLMKAAKIDDGRLLLAVLNMSLDPIDELELCFDREVSSVKRLRADGEYESVDFIKADGKLTLATSAVVFDPVILIVD